MGFKPSIHKPYVLGKLPEKIKYAANGKKRDNVVKIAKLIAAAFLLEFTTENEKVCSHKRILKIWKDRDQGILDAALAAIRNRLILDSQELIEQSLEFISSEVIFEQKNEIEAERIYTTAGHLYNKLRHHDATGARFEECRNSAAELQEIRHNIRGKCQDLEWAKGTAHLPPLSMLSVANSAAPVCGQAKMDKLTLKRRSSYGAKNQGLSKMITSLKKKMSEVVSKYDAVDLLLKNQEGVQKSLKRLAEGDAIIDRDISSTQLVDEIEKLSEEMAVKIRKLSTLAPAVSGVGFGYAVGRAGLNPTYILSHSIKNGDSDLLVRAVFNAQQKCFDAAFVDEVLRDKTTEQKKSKSKCGHFSKTRYTLYPTRISVDDIFGVNSSDDDDDDDNDEGGDHGTSETVE